MENYTNPWLWLGQPFTSEHICDYEGFVYIITNTLTGKMYIGRKYFWSKTRTRKKTKGKRTRRITKESDWKTYYGSSEEVQKDVCEKGEMYFKREILSLHKTRGATNYAEIEEQINRRVIEDDSYYNKSINGKYYNINLNESQFIWARGDAGDWHSKQWRQHQSEFMKRRMRNIIHITDGVTTRQIQIGEEIPIGWRRGMTKKGQSDAIKRAWARGSYARRKRPSTPVWNKGISPSSEVRKKISDALMGHHGWNLGKKHSEETRMKMRQSRAGKVWYHHSISNKSKMYRPGTEPDGYIRGRGRRATSSQGTCRSVRS